MKLFIILVLILFIPIPLKLNLYVHKNKYTLKLYRFTLISNTRRDILKKKHPFDKSSKIKKRKLDIKKTIVQLYNSHFKPFLNIKMNLEYSFNDAAKTAISYGILSEIPPISNNVLKIVFNIIKFNFKIEPKFADELILNFKLNSIIFLSLAHIINILIIVLSNYKKQ